MILSVDPSVEGYGLALWDKSGQLVRAWYELASVQSAVGNFVGVTEVVIERPQVYLNSLKSANDAIVTALAAGELAGRLRQLSAEPVITYVVPARWKGQIKKAAHHPWIKAELSDDEHDRMNLNLKNKKHRGDVLDAVGIGLWAVGRSERGKRAGRKAS